MSETLQRMLQAEINAPQSDRQTLEEKYGQVWNTEELQRDFEVLAFGAPFVEVRRRSDGKEGSLMFQHGPRFYFKWEEK